MVVAVIDMLLFSGINLESISLVHLLCSMFVSLSCLLLAWGSQVGL